MKKPVYFEFLEKCQGGCVEIINVFINPDIYLGIANYNEFASLQAF